MATNFTDPPCESDGSLLPLHRLLIRLHFHFLLRFSSDRRLPIFPVRKAHTLQKAWALIVENANETIPNLEESYGIKLGNFTYIVYLPNISRRFVCIYISSFRAHNKENQRFCQCLSRI